jgi:hypothetical protein
MDEALTPYMNENDGHPLIKQFAMPKISVQNESTGTKKHTCSITFDAPTEVNEHKMMDYIMGIEEALGAKVVKFSWSLSENK